MIKYVHGNIPGKGMSTIAVIEGDTHLSKWITEDARLDHDNKPGGLLPLIMDLINPGDVVVDGGACLGDHTAAYAIKAKSVLAFEPNPEAYECLCRNVDGLSVVRFGFGLSDKWSVKGMSTDPNLGASRVVDSGGAARIVVGPLDDIFGGRVSLIKLDIEGYEVKALSGARLTIARCLPVLVLEVNRGCLESAGDSVEALGQMLDELGYDALDIHSGEPFRVDDPRPMYDIVCRPKEQTK